VDEPSIGIDLGTTNSVVATVVGGKARIIERREGQRLLASMVGYTPRGERVVGEDARNLARTHPQNVAYATKRLMGQRWTPELAAHYRTLFPYPLVAGPNNDVRVKLAERAIPVAQIAAALLGELHRDAAAFLGQEVTKTVITVPANFNDAQRQATKEAAQIAGLDVIRLINEPTAAALAYGVQTRFQGRVLVFDLGGGTLDVSILEMRDGVFEVVGSGGDPFLGGEDFDNAMVDNLSALLPPSLRDRLMKDRSVLQQLKTTAEHIKCSLSVTNEASVATTIECGLGSIPLEAKFTRAEFESLVSGLTERCMACIDRTLSDAHMPTESITQVILVGGMTRVPVIRERVGKRFGINPSTHLFPDEVVALGAALYADDLVAKKATAPVLVDIVSSTLGVGVAFGLARPLLRKNRSLPCSAKEVFYPANDQQTMVRIPVVQGEGGHVKENHLLGEVVLDKLIGSCRSEKAIEVTFELDLNCSLSVQACEVSTGRTASVQVQARTDLRPQEIERLRQEESRRHQEVDGDRETRQKNAELRRSFRKQLVAFRRVHSELIQAAEETGGQDARMVVDVLGQRLVDAERLEQTGSVQEVEAITRNLEDLLKSLVGTNPAEPTKAAAPATAPEPPRPPAEPAKPPAEPVKAAQPPMPAEPPPAPPEEAEAIEATEFEEEPGPSKDAEAVKLHAPPKESRKKRKAKKKKAR
jgi:molecular chaperone DnaK